MYDGRMIESPNHPGWHIDGVAWRSNAHLFVDVISPTATSYVVEVTPEGRWKFMSPDMPDISPKIKEKLMHIVGRYIIDRAFGGK